MNNNLVSLTVLKKVIKDKNLDKYIKKIEYAKDNIHKYIITNINDKKIKFGSINYQDYLTHLDNIRRDNFRKRFFKLYQKNKNNIDSAIFWSWNLLW